MRPPTRRRSWPRSCRRSSRVRPRTVAANDVLPDYYRVLQVHPDADDEVIAAAYRQLMKKYHPDVAGEDPARIAEHVARSKAINEAFGVLRDPRQRRQYDSARVYFGTARPARAASDPRAWEPARESAPSPPASSPPSAASASPAYSAPPP